MQTVQLEHVAGVEAAAEWGARTLVAEVRIPFGDGPVAIEPGGDLGVGVELPDTSVRGIRRSAPPRGRGADDEAVAEGPPTITRWLRVEL